MNKSWTPDDLEDLTENSRLIVDHFYEILEGQNFTISMSSLNIAVFKIILTSSDWDLNQVEEDCETFYKGLLSMLKAQKYMQ